ncbi:MAG: hypothetical protein K2J67_09190 [Lachnospiraceae bacterium]|nr:hypothetical protein [Lachnospiraceae bacterium]
MSSSGFVLKEQGDWGFADILYDLKLASQRAGLEPRIKPKVHSFYGDIFMEGNLANTYEDRSEAQQWVMSLYDNDKDLHRFEHVKKNGNLVRIIVIERISECEKILLDFLFEYFKLNPKDYFWVEGYKWHYTYKDIKKIKQSDFNPDWCYKDPHVNISHT